MKRRIRSVAAALVMALCLSLAAPMSAAADYGGVDYNRINFSVNGKVYPAQLSFGGMSFGGRLRCTNNFTKDDVNDAIKEVFDAAGLNEKKLKEAQKKIDAAKKDRQFTYEDVAHIADNLVHMLGKGNELDNAKYMAETISRFLTMASETDTTQTRLDLVLDSIARAQDMTTDKIKDWAFDEAFLEMFCASYDTFISQYDIKLGKFGKINPVTLVIETAKVSYAEFKLDQERWNRRIEAVKAGYLLDAFYEAVNKTIENWPGYKGTWRLKIVSSRDRRFSFLGSSGNLQRWSVVVDLVNTSRDYASSPMGDYRGVVGIFANHNMTPFDRNLWYTGYGQFPAGWLTGVIKSGFYKVSMGGGTGITLKMIDNDFKLFIGALDALYAFGPRNKGRPIRVKVDTSQFETNEVQVNSDRWLKVNTSIGFTDEKKEKLFGYVVVNIAQHAEGLAGGGDGIRIVSDKLEGDVAVLLGIKADMQRYGVEEAVVWDRNIWAPLEGGVQFSIGG